MIMSKKILFTIGGLFLLGVTVLVFFSLSKRDAYADLLCPTQYPTAEAAATGFQQFSDQYYAAHPNGSLQDMLAARIDFYKSHNCTVELERYQQAMDGTADPAAMAKIYGEIQGTATTTNNTSP